MPNRPIMKPKQSAKTHRANCDFPEYVMNMDLNKIDRGWYAAYVRI